MISFLLRLLWNLARVPFAPFWFIARRAAFRRAAWLTVRIRSRVVEIAAPPPWFSSFVPGYDDARPTSLVALRKLAEHAAVDPRVRGVVFEIPALSCGWATADALRHVIASLRAAGKETVAYLPHGGGHKELFVATACARIFASPTATFALPGLAAETRYYGALLRELGVEVEVFARAEYKTAMESWSRDRMSDAQREQVEALLRTIDGHLRDALAARPRIGVEGVARVFSGAMWSGASAVEVGLVDGLAYADELPAKVDVPSVTRARFMPAAPWVRWKEAKFFAPLFRRPYVAVVPVHGMISEAGRRRWVSSLRAVAADPYAVGAVIHVDSPGGSALVSDLVHREVELLREKKPVVACFGDVAASGGYYVAAPSHAIVASPLSVTGSIGVVSARPVAEKLLHRFGIHTEVIRTAPHADMFSLHRPLDDAERAILEREMEQTYATFVGVVARGRGKPVEDIEPLARGRVWSGQDAHARGMVDAFGGLERARDEVRARLGDRGAVALPFGLIRLPPWAELPPLERSDDKRGEALNFLRRWTRGWAPGVEEVWSLTQSGERLFLYAANAPDIA